MKSINNILKEYWGYDSFRPLQEESINSVLAEKDTLVLFPTGGGKSICYQVPALALDGLTLVISPLIALMKDQVIDLKKRGIKADAIHSGMHPEELHTIFSNAIYGGTKLLYISPERINTKTFKNNIPLLNIQCIAVDEAHCISQWGFDFRPPYRDIAQLRNYYPLAPILALTATATPEVVEDICSQLQFRPHANIYQKSFIRKNLAYIVQNEEDKIGRIKRIINNIGGSGIVYVRNRKKTQDIAKLLSKYTTTDFYHAGLDMKSRHKKQMQWMNGTTNLMVATNAFGMGIDKSDVRYVVHLDIPDTVESYFQEAGRAGRDEKNAFAVLLYNQGDIDALRKSFPDKYPELRFITNIYEALINYFGTTPGTFMDKPLSFDINDFCHQYHFQIIPVYSALMILERDGYLSMNDGIKQPSKIHIKVNRENLYRYQLESPQDDSLIKLLLRSYSGLFTQYTTIYESSLAIRMNTTVDKIKNRLMVLNQKQILNYIPSNDKPQIIYTQPILQRGQLSISHNHYLQRQKQAKEKMEAMISYIQNNELCRSKQLLLYFNEKTSTPCNACDVCISINKNKKRKKESDIIMQETRQRLKSKAYSYEELSSKYTLNEQECLNSILQFLLDNHKIETHAGKYQWKNNHSS